MIMNIDMKKIRGTVFFLLLIFSATSYSMEQGPIKESKQEEESSYFNNLLVTGSSIIQGQQDIMAAYNAVYNTIKNTNVGWLTAPFVQKWLFDALYAKFMPAKYDAVPDEEDAFAQTAEIIMNNAVYDAIRLVAADNAMNKELAFKYFLSWMGFESKQEFEDFFSEELAANKDNIERVTLIVAVLQYANDHPEIFATLSLEGKEQPLHVAAAKNNINAMKVLLKNKSKEDIFKLINNLNEDGDTPLHIAARNKGGATATQFLLENGTNPISINSDSETPLHLAAGQGNVEQAKLLLEYGTTINAQSDEQNTPLHVAVLEQQPNMVKFLLDNGADVTIANDDGLMVSDFETSDDIQQMIQEAAQKRKKQKLDKNN